MIVNQIGYLNLGAVNKLKENGKLFSIYKTNKNTVILVLNTKKKSLHLSYPQKNRLPFKVVEGKKIAKCELIVCSETAINITADGWNNNDQIMAYEEFNLN